MTQYDFNLFLTVIGLSLFAAMFTQLFTWSLALKPPGRFRLYAWRGFTLTLALGGVVFLNWACCNIALDAIYMAEPRLAIYSTLIMCFYFVLYTLGDWSPKTRIQGWVHDVQSIVVEAVRLVMLAFCGAWIGTRVYLIWNAPHSIPVRVSASIMATVATLALIKLAHSYVYGKTDAPTNFKRVACVAIWGVAAYLVADVLATDPSVPKGTPSPVPAIQSDFESATSSAHSED